MEHTQLTSPQIIVAGHICLDIIPAFPPADPSGRAAMMFAPGSLTRVGQAACSTGGTVANVGLALHRLGVPVGMIARIGEDMFGRQIVQILNEAGPGLADALAIVPHDNTSYSIVISPPGRDRFFLHCPGANDHFSAVDVTPDKLAGARLFHFGYPPVMRGMLQDHGTPLHEILSIAQQSGLATSLDMCSVDPASEAGQLHWKSYLKNVLPAVDVFLPSLDELRFMLGRPGNDAAPSPAELAELSNHMLADGAAVVVLKLGHHGLYVRASADLERLARCPIFGRDRARAWCGQEARVPCFQVDVAGTTGSGDCTIAGFLAALLRGESIHDAAEAAVAVGACSVEQPDAVSGVMPWPQIRQRIQRGWAKHPLA